MGGPSAELAQAIADLAEQRSIPVNVYEAPVSQLTAPAIVVRPDSPWVLVDPDGTFSSWAERYAVVCVSAAGDPISAKDQLRELVVLVRDVAGGSLRSWAFVQASGIAPAEDSGIDYLATTVQVNHAMED